MFPRCPWRHCITNYTALLILILLCFRQCCCTSIRFLLVMNDLHQALVASLYYTTPLHLASQTHILWSTRLLRTPGLLSETSPVGATRYRTKEKCNPSHRMHPIQLCSWETQKSLLFYRRPQILDSRIYLVVPKRTHPP